MYELLKTCFRGSKGGAVVEHLPPNNVTWVQILAFKATCGLSLLLVLSVALRRFLYVLWFSPLIKTNNTSKFQFELECMDMFKRVHNKS